MGSVPKYLIIQLFCSSTGSTSPARRVPTVFSARDAADTPHSRAYPKKLPVGVGKDRSSVRMKRNSYGTLGFILFIKLTLILLIINLFVVNYV